ncbi:MAG: 7-carboxy-7-deazaguanine synthase QueE [Chlorobi bacterium]|nr:7-carboxy-7-deazaguanine synthase QueE [Chlorobiota bacterium]
MKSLNKKKETLFAAGKMLPLVEEFYTIQGEGFHTGKAAYFIRIGGCDVGCSWCDTKFSWDPYLHPMVETDRIIKNALQSGARDMVITGGEPLMFNLIYLTRQLKIRGFNIYLETSGAWPMQGTFDWICLSPKQSKKPLRNIYTQADELKVIIQTKNDLAWAEENAGKVPDKCFLFLQPEWSQYERIIGILVEYVKRNPKWRISLQAHKFMHVP